MTSPLVKLFENVRCTVLGIEPPSRLRMPALYDVTVSSSTDLSTRQRIMLCAVTLGYKHVVEEEVMLRSRAEAEYIEREIRNRTVQALGHELYGPIADEVWTAFFELERLGVSRESEPMKRLMSVVDAARGEDLPE